MASELLAVAEVLLLRGNGEARVGTAFAIDNKRLVTARHVLDGAEGDASKLRVRFVTYKTRRKVRSFSPILPGDEIAVLRLRAHVPDKLTRVHLAEFAGSARANDAWRAPGYPKRGDSKMDFITGTVVAVSEIGDRKRLHLRCHEAPSKILGGFSGSPVVIIEDRQALVEAVGVILSNPTLPEDSRRSAGGVVFAYPSEELVGDAPELGPNYYPREPRAQASLPRKERSVEVIEHRGDRPVPDTTFELQVGEIRFTIGATTQTAIDVPRRSERPKSRPVAPSDAFRIFIERAR